MGLDSRIGPQFLRPGIGYGGSCFPKDVAAFRSVAEQLGIDFNLLTEVEKINVQQKKRFLNKVRSALWTLRGKRIGVLGLAFKGETDDIRESPAIDIVEMLLAEGCTIAAYDPAAMKRTAGDSSCRPQPSLRRRRLRRRRGCRRAAHPHRLGGVRRARPRPAQQGSSLSHHHRRPQPLRPRYHDEHGFTYLSIGRPAAYPVRESSATPSSAS